MKDKTQEFLELFDRVKNCKHGDNLDETYKKMHEILPDVNKSVLRDAAKVCSLGFDMGNTVQKADFVAGLNNDEDKINEYRAKFLKEEIDYFFSLDLFPENESSTDNVVHYFKDEFHEKIWGIILPDEKKPERIAVPIPDLFYAYGSTLFELGNFEDAENELHSAVIWNLTDAPTTFEYAESLKQNGNLEQFFVKTISAWQVAFTKEDVARVFRNLAFFFSEQQDWQNAYINLILSSMYYDDEEKITRELEYIQQNADTELQEVTQEMIEAYGEETEMPIGANPAIIDLLDSYCAELHEKEEYMKSLPYLQNLYDLTDNPDVKKLIKEIKSGNLKKEK